MNDVDRDQDRLAAQRVLAPMREGPLGLAVRADQEAALRGRVLEALRAQMSEEPLVAHARKQRRTMITVASGVAFAAAAAAALAWLPRADAPSSSPSVAQVAGAVRVEAIDAVQGGATTAAAWIDAAGESHALLAGAQSTELPSGTLELHANDTAPRLRTSQGVEMKLSPQARLRVTSVRQGDGPELRLLAGEVACAVPKLGATRQFAIDAPGARVIVHGTRFSVRASKSKTCVRVTEGLVAVHPDASDAPVKRLGPGEQWGCDDASGGDEQSSRTRKARRPARAAEVEPIAAPEETGTLDTENRLLAEALSAERRNDRARAQRLFAELLRDHPSSPLAIEAARGLKRTREQ